MKREGAQDRINAFLEIPNELLQPFIASHLAQEPQEPPARVRFLIDALRQMLFPYPCRGLFNLTPA